MQTRSASMVLLVFLLFVPICLQPAWTAESENVYAIDPNDPVALQEATRILAEEVKLAARPQTYIIVDLVDRSLVIKGRGAELHRLPIQQWSAVHLAEATATFRLQARPPVSRRKVEPLAAGDQPPVSLDDMPIDFTLKFSPSFIMVVHPSASDDFWRWLRVTGREWWMWMKEWAWRLSTGYEPAVYPVLHLTLTPHHAQSLAWTVTQGMPLLVRRASPPTS
jgi:hypothetical protein